MWTRCLLAFLLLVPCACRRKPVPPPDAQVQTLGSMEVTARLLEVPEGSILRRDLYTYAAVLKYQVLAVHRGSVAPGQTLYVAHYNPHLPRERAADRFMPDVGGHLAGFDAGQVHRMALDPRADDVYLGALIDPYWQDRDKQVRWARWTLPADEVRSMAVR